MLLNSLVGFISGVLTEDPLSTDIFDVFFQQLFLIGVLYNRLLILNK
jgi:hypothetical protein